MAAMTFNWNFRYKNIDQMAKFDDHGYPQDAPVKAASRWEITLVLIPGIVFVFYFTPNDAAQILVSGWIDSAAGTVVPLWQKHLIEIAFYMSYAVFVDQVVFGWLRKLKLWAHKKIGITAFPGWLMMVLFDCEFYLSPRENTNVIMMYSSVIVLTIRIAIAWSLRIFLLALPYMALLYLTGQSIV